MPTRQRIPAVPGPPAIIPLRLVQADDPPGLQAPQGPHLIALVRAISQQSGLVSPELAIYLPPLINMMEAPVDLDSPRGWLLGEFAERLGQVQHTGTPAMQAGHQVLHCALIIARRQVLTEDDVSAHLTPYLDQLPRLPEPAQSRRRFTDARKSTTCTAFEILYPSS